MQRLEASLSPERWRKSSESLSPSRLSPSHLSSSRLSSSRLSSSGVPSLNRGVSDRSINDSEFDWLRSYMIRERSKVSNVEEAIVEAAVEEAASLQPSRGVKHTLADSASEET
ncbi:MAG: hypothetical protein SGPRY_012424, partial [Prymnesium sp.]